MLSSPTTVPCLTWGGGDGEGGYDDEDDSEDDEDDGEDDFVDLTAHSAT